MLKKSPYIALTLFLCIVYIFFFGEYQHFTISSLKLWQEDIKNFYSNSPLITVFIYFILYIFITSISLPGAGVLTLAGGFLFGLVKGTVLVSFASSIGAFIAFSLARFYSALIIAGPKSRETKGEKKTASYIKLIKIIKEKIKKEGAWYLLTLRLIPLFPFFIVNIAMGFTSIKAHTFFWVSQLGMLPATLLYVNAGVRLSEIKTLKDIISFPIFLSLILLGLFPISAKIVIKQIQKNKIKTLSE